MHILKLLKMNEIIPKVKSIEDVRKSGVDLIPNQKSHSFHSKYEDLENLTQKSIEFYKQINSTNNYSSFEKSERINRENLQKSLVLNDVRMRDSKSSLVEHPNYDLKRQKFEAAQAKPTGEKSRSKNYRYDIYKSNEVSYPFL